MSTIFNEVFYRPLLNLLFLIYNLTIADLGVAIIVLTIIIRLLLLPLFYKSTKDQTIIQKITPRIKELQKIYKEDKEKQVQEILKVYKDHKVNPFSGFLILLIQIPILIALYRVFVLGFSADTLSGLYSFVSPPQSIHTTFLGLIDLNNKNILIVIIAAIFQYLQSRLMLSISKQKNNSSSDSQDKMADMAQRISRNMVLISPLLTVLILYPLPAAVGLYWLTTSAFSFVQQLFINKKISNYE
jgi:YidC/Oxa1 family membrane protein insertase